MKKIIFGIAIGITLGSGIVYAAVTYKASDISYDASDTSWEVDNVNDALNSLYDKQKNNTKKALVFTSSPVDMKQYTDRWAELTNADFKAGVTSADSSAKASNGNTGTCSTNYSISYNYNASTGQLTFSSSGTGYSNAGDSGKVENRLSVGGIFAVWLGTIGGN